MAGLARSVAAAILLLSMTTFGFAANRVIIILDASGSMWAQIDGKPKLEIARESLRTVLQSVPGDDEIGFMAYGHRQKGSCADIELIVPPQAGSASAISAAADSMKFLGKTPLTAAVKQAAEALKYTEDKATVVLITDGLETCGGDPCALGKELKETGVDFTADVVGFGLTADEGRQIACLAENTGGKYIQASDEKALQQALVETVAAPAPAPEPAPAPAPAPAPEPAKPEFNFTPSVVMAEGGDAVTDGNAWEIYKAKSDGSRGDQVMTEYGELKINLEPGDYIVVGRADEARSEQKIKIEAGQTYSPLFTLNAGTLVIHPHASQGSEISGEARVDFAYPGGSTTHYGDTKATVPAGEQKVTVQIGAGTVTETIQLAAGQTVEKDIVVGVGHAVLNAYYTAGGDKADNSGIGFEIVKAKKKIDGSRESVEHSYGPDSKFWLPPDDYVALTTLDLAVVEQPFSIKAGDNQDVKVALGAGVLAMSAPGAYSIEVFSSKKDAEGKRKSLGLTYGDSWQQTIPAGDYVVVRHMSDQGQDKEMPVTIKAGERSEITVQ
ncbi:VWA domain-containing protein [Mesorhizobium sp. M1A.F.Ca.IN.020.30.1.1]|uniref:vWA domain-containing protein n=4 Tax=Mesorhizobium TaxID=68287 RepID=UPI000FCC1D25|nr:MULTISPECIES: VWA domain-containing protein [unclassified Mesorhizobium]MCT2580641.1 VWA domain-containing protein [Mesorhizobium sp. P13.3]MDF3169583.1 VWA domain-containing protein [Mesorhizobium sp. P16.1]MDF3179565.1 VWA domain-containing protein [Mesorhizobium sp. P17.1]MDF3186498.1 VWA domain-containing protein [Mesorhizobium sp. ICCV3110.1]RUV59026.1 VWA domain-containing protein [Mesorhizobium sp. M1A.F.Ca.IN.022.02.1.1]